MVSRLDTTENPDENLVEMPAKLKVKDTMAAHAAALYLELLAAGLRKGKGRFFSRKKTLAFEAPADVDFEMRVKLDPANDEGRIKIVIGWSRNEDAQTDGGVRVTGGNDEPAG